jgi:hypothetical protein
MLLASLYLNMLFSPEKYQNIIRNWRRDETLERGGYEVFQDTVLAFTWERPKIINRKCIRIIVKLVQA